ncbi:MAG: ferritin-like domain-containing protein [Desulfurococcales archaeon]|nr:ferritin-like domain-containing protein [Desulfurococcales archaeon]
MSELDLDKILKMVEEEKKYAEELEELSKSFRHPVLQAMIRGIARDSFKHSILYEAIARLLKETQPALTEEELKLIKEGLEKHIKMEAEMVRLTSEWARQTSDPRLKLLLTAIHEDEVKHHKILVDIKDRIAEAETLTEQDIWDAVWKDSPWHGSPGG